MKAGVFVLEISLAAFMAVGSLAASDFTSRAVFAIASGTLAAWAFLIATDGKPWR